MKLRTALLTLAFIISAVSFAGCRPPNLPESVRWWLFANFGANQICPELQKRSMTLKLSDNAPGIGRFFPSECSHTVNDQLRTVTVHISGTGYGYIAPARRVGFSLQTSVEYRPDFWFVDDDMYVWGKLNRVVDGPKFQLGYVENPVIDLAANLPPLGNLANILGDQIVQGQLAQGFTVVRNLDTDTDSFTLGILSPPRKPFTPYDVSKSERYTFANEIVDVYAGQRDYLGPFEIAESGQRLDLRMTVVGPAVDVMVVDKFTGDAWRDSYKSGRPLGPPPGPVAAGSPLQPGPELYRAFTLPRGLYYVVLDNTSAAGLVNPPPGAITPLSATASRVTYLAQLAE